MNVNEVRGIMHPHALQDVRASTASSSDCPRVWAAKRCVPGWYLQPRGVLLVVRPRRLQTRGITSCREALLLLSFKRANFASWVLPKHNGDHEII